MRDLKWIACESVSLNPYNLSVIERLRDFGYALVFDEFGNGKTDKAQLCIYDIIARKSNSDRKPSILIICPESLLQNWYSSLVSEIGVDFKFISDLGDTVSFYSDCISNLFIISDVQLKQSKQIGSSRRSEIWGITDDSEFVWDLMIIDAGLSVEGADWEGYYEHCHNRAFELLVFAPCPFPYDEDLSSSMLKRMLRRFLADKNQVGAVADLEIDENIITFDKKTPAMRYSIPGKTRGKGPKVITLEYKIDKKIFNFSNRLADTREGRSSYVYGGNVFEEYNPHLKTTYLLPRYHKGDVDTLRRADAKLDVFLEKLDEVLKTPENNVVVYFASKVTLEYINKVINAVFPELNERVVIQTDSVLDAGFLRRRFSGDKPVRARVILAGDAIDEKYYGIQNVTHVFNYEYPDNPAELERRFLRTGRSLQTGLFEIGNLRPEEFIVFSDKDMMYDGRMLCKVMMSRLPACFKKKIPSRNVLFWIPDAHKYMVEALKDLKNIAQSINKADCDSVRLLRRFGKEYNITDYSLIDSPDKAEEFARMLFDGLIELVDIDGEITSANFEDRFTQIEEESASELVEIGVEKIRGGHIYYDDFMNPCTIRNTNNLDEIAKQYEYNEFVMGVKESIQALEFMLDMVHEGDYPFVSTAVGRLPDGLKFPVLYNIWKYCKFKKGINKPLKEFMDAYNKGVI
jgi:hypothetical protein